MQIVDAQVHIWPPNTPEHPWPGERIEPHRAEPFMRDELLAEMDAAGVDRAVLVPPMWAGDSNAYALSAVRSHPQRFAVMGRLDLDAPASRGAIATWRNTPGLLGIRIVPKRQPIRAQFAAGHFDWLWREAEKAGVPIMILIETDQADLLAAIATRHPGLKFVLDHLCLPSGLKDDKAFAHLDKVLALAKHPNIAAKASALQGFTDERYPFKGLHSHIRRVYDAFGPQRMFWGTDLTHIPCTYKEAAGLFTNELPWLTAEDKEWILGRGIREWIGWQ